MTDTPHKKSGIKEDSKWRRTPDRICCGCGKRVKHELFSTPRVKRCKACIENKVPVQFALDAANTKEKNLKRRDLKSTTERRARVKAARKEREKDNNEWAKDKRASNLQRQSAVRARNPIAEKTAPKKVVEKELANRKLAREKLIYFILRVFPEYKAGWVHNLICTKLERFSDDVIAEKEPRLMIFLPPRHGKSEIASKNFPAWHLGRAPKHEIIAASYGVSLPMGFSRKIKDMIKSPAYSAVFPDTKLHREAQATEGWLTTQGGGYVPAGVGGGITGKGAHVLIIDDPVKDANEADSELIRENNWDWYGSTARTRLAPGGGILVIQTRWHDADLSGKLIEQMQKDLAEIDEEVREAEEQGASEYTLNRIKKKYDEVEKWEIINLPALAEQEEYFNPHNGAIEFEQATPESRFLRHIGEALHPKRFGETALLKMKRTMSKRHWSALMQQNPVPDDGDIFTRNGFRMIPSRPRLQGHHIYIAWDLAIGLKQRNDWSVGLVGAVNEHGFLIIYDMIRVKTDKLASLILDTALLYRGQLQEMGLEQGQIQMAIMPELKRLMDEKKYYPVMTDKLKPITDKVARARPAQGMVQHGRVLLPEDQPWVETFLAELLRFPNGLHDDIVDGLSWLCRMVEGQTPPKPVTKTKKIKSWKDRIKKLHTNRIGGAMGA